MTEVKPGLISGEFRMIDNLNSCLVKGLNGGSALTLSRSI